MNIAFILNVNQDVIYVNNYKKIKFFGQDLIEITLKIGWYIQ